MVADIQYVIIFILASAGGIFTALLGWMDSGEPFHPRKFMASVLRAIGGGVVLVGVEFAFPSEITVKTYFIAILAGMGADVLGNRVAGAVRAKPP